MATSDGHGQTGAATVLDRSVSWSLPDSAYYQKTGATGTTYYYDQAGKVVGWHGAVPDKETTGGGVEGGAPAPISIADKIAQAQYAQMLANQRYNAQTAANAGEQSAKDTIENYRKSFLAQGDTFDNYRRMTDLNIDYANEQAKANNAQAALTADNQFFQAYQKLQNARLNTNNNLGSGLYGSNLYETARLYNLQDDITDTNILEGYRQNMNENERNRADAINSALESLMDNATTFRGNAAALKIEGETGVKNILNDTRVNVSQNGYHASKNWLDQNGEWNAGGWNMLNGIGVYQGNGGDEANQSGWYLDTNQADWVRHNDDGTTMGWDDYYQSVFNNLMEKGLVSPEYLSTVRTPTEVKKGLSTRYNTEFDGSRGGTKQDLFNTYSGRRY